MAERITWDEYETALLIDTFWRIEKTPNRKRELIKGLSDDLRRKGINSGITIDEKFRNVNGITMQLSSIAHAFFPERPTLTSSVMFSRMVEIYKTDRETFNKTLAIAKSMVVGDTVAPLPVNEPQQEVASKDISSILKKHYQYGFKPNSYRELLRFRQFAEADGVVIPEDEDELNAAILSAGTMVDGKVFAKSDDLGKELCDIVNTIVESGTKAIYYEALLERHNEWMLSHFITSEAMLKELLQKNLKGFAFSKKFMAAGTKKTEKQAVTDEIKRIWGENKTCSVEEIGERLPYIPIGNIWRVISGNVNFVWVAEGVYLLIDRFIISDDEKDAILEYVETACNKKGFASLSDVPREEIEEQNYEISQTAILSAIYNKVLDGKYILNGKILTKDNASLDAVALLKQHLEGREKYTFSELADKVVELTGGTNRQFAFQALYDCMVRIDTDNYVADKFVSFNVDEIDSVLSGIITNHFCAVRGVTTFALFPVCGYSWNSFLLESYCYKYSKKYNLRLLNFNDKNAGIIAEKNYDKSYIEMLAIALADAKIELNQEEIGLYLFQTGYMAKRKYARLGEIAVRAKELREDK